MLVLSVCTMFGKHCAKIMIWVGFAFVLVSSLSSLWNIYVQCQKDSKFSLLYFSIFCKGNKLSRKHSS
jgi:uncharacterized PurR-regulated membrane protein YhhQ (DUF165 family)